MTIAKKRKLTKIFLFTAGTVAVGGSVGIAIFATRVNSKASQDINAAFREDDPKINKNEVVIDNSQNSNTDSNLTPIEKEKNTTVLIFKNGNDILMTKKVITNKDDSTPLDINAYIPNGWKLDTTRHENNNVAISVGQENVIYVVKEDILYKTTIIFIVDDQIFQTLEISTINNQGIDIEKYVPQGYEIVDVAKQKIELGVTNRIKIQKVVQKHRTTLLFTYKNGVVSREVVDSINDEAINYLKFVPKGYIFDEETNGVDFAIKLDQNNYIAVKPYVIPHPEDNSSEPKEPTTTPEQPEDNRPPIFTPVEPPVDKDKEKENTDEVKFIKTTLRFILEDNTEIASIQIENKDTEEDVIKVEPYLPAGYIVDKSKYTETDGLPVIKKGETNDIIVVQEKKVITTTVVFYLLGNKFGEAQEFTSLEGEGLNVNVADIVPEGYTLAENQDTNLVVGVENRINIVKKVYKHKTTLTFYEGLVPLSKSVVDTVDDETIDVKRYVPEGYELDPEHTLNIVLDTENKIYVKPLPKPKPDPVPVEPTPKPNPKPDPSTLAPRNSSGTYVIVDNYVPDYNETTVKPTTPGALSSEAVRAVEKQISDLEKVYKFVENIDSIDKLNETELSNLTVEMGITGYEADNFKNFVRMLIDPLQFPHLYKNRWYITKESFKHAIKDTKAKYKEFANKGMIPAMNYWQTWPRINAGGVWTYASDDDNPVYNQYKGFNKARFFPSDSKYMRTSGHLLSGDYVGWTKGDVTSKYKDIDTNSYNPSNPREPRGDGIKVFEYRPNADNAVVTDKNQKIYVAWLDASNPKGYAKFETFIRTHSEIAGVVIENMGLLDKNQAFDNLLANLPSHVKKLTLFFETTNTQSLSALKNKQLDDIEILTKSPNVSSSLGIEPLWGIDPIAFRYTRNVSFDYNNNASGEYASGTVRAGSIQFNIVRPSASSSESEVKEAFRIAYVTKKDWKIFQGSFGDGSWPTWIDLSLQPKFRSLKGLELGGKVFYNLKLHNDSEIFTVFSDDIDQQQWDKLIVKGPQRSKLTFDNPNVNSLYIKGLAYNLPNNYNPQLYGLFEAGKQVFRTLYVDNQAMKDAIMNTQAWRTFGSNFTYGIKIIDSSLVDENNGGIDNGI
ncbi:Uncharacterised protein [Metamycoplasma cloacale]|uniref:Putative immunoglobulin-blocking virulence protein n=1 Tax=Metamycoplasma cloacale TaxID=92401 RepID=A0A2Z4LLH7_9BACT|nr:putative immunoglobulin-blocking virulence protein [Metamycoplasma cloacale]AWX42573.1 putative immunoglobulin-blocking virulence protein [Metamycoplasma cloacale]VEU79720.1 Uncharacterised protein [Metamycoplasma cloacale]